MLRVDLMAGFAAARALVRTPARASRGERPAATAHVADEDALLVGAARNGDGEAFDLLVERHAARLHAVARRLVGDHVAEDVVQEALWAAYRGLDRFRGEARFATYLHAVLVRQCQRARRLRRPWAPLTTETHASERPGPGEEAERTALARELDAALARLPRREREVLVLRESGGLAYDEIASLLAMPIGTVRSRIARGRARMRAWLEARGIRP